MTKLPLRVINLWTGPGAGKSTTAAGLFNLMKNQGLSVELVTEVAKEFTWQKDYGSLQNQLLLLALQDQRLRRLVGQVKWAITDSPLPQGLAYCTEEYEDWLPITVEGAHSRYDNYDILLYRKKPYVAAGRLQTESAALALDLEIASLCRAFSDEGRLWEVDAFANAPYEIMSALDISYDGMDP